MTLVVPILLAAVLSGLFVRRMTASFWFSLFTWILVVVLYYFIKH